MAVLFLQIKSSDLNVQVRFPTIANLAVAEPNDPYDTFDL